MPDSANAGAAFVPDQIAEIATSGLTGLPLNTALEEVFSKASRPEARIGLVLTVMLFEADRVGLLFELMQAEAKLAELQSRGSAP